ncbi:uncharacterized protein ARMOST_11712 [Armillaria ostoyae]|uniref:Reverse transcriptase domain-containing protein n=1 Tax=Armillaria ostoyae TaxID=47428 RepID=A0A284RHV9_ARMOS|nr:uncharacterized protein ARMOST_11712 [Armillaria ostoyae]
MNPPSSPSTHIDPVLKNLADLLVETLPDHTTDHSPLQSFSRLLIVPKVLRGMEHLQHNEANASPGIDAISQKDVLAIPAEELVCLFNYCLQNNEIPQAWLLSLLAAVLKKGRDLMTPENYCIIGLQSCLMKLLTLIIDFWVMEWMDNASILPHSQNSFRCGNHTHNNSFILCMAIDHAHTHDLSVLWTKLHQLGVGGAIDMEYIIKVGKSCSDTFTSSIGVLAGDSLSPMLWNIYFSNFTVSDHLDDVVWEGCEIALDIDLTVSEELRQVSLTFLHHLLSVHPKTGVAFLHAETSIMPLYFHHLILALQYLHYLSALPDDHLDSLALHESVSLCHMASPSWFRDLQHVLAQLAPSININYDDLSVPRLSSLIDNVEAICLQSLNDDIEDMVKGSMLCLSMKHVPGIVSLHPRKKTLSRCSYLSILIPAHRKALTHLLVSSHVFAVEVLRWLE